jgi:hypothetical protein
MPRVLLANEFGLGRGHLVTLRQLGQAFGGGVQFDAALCQRRHENVLAPLGASVFDGPCLCMSPDNAARRGQRPTATGADHLGDLGFDSVPRLRDIVAWWREVLVSRRVDLVVGEYAPLALLSARSLGLPTIAVGHGFGLPPHDMKTFPFLNPEQTECLHDEQALLANVNQVVADTGLPRLKGLPEVFRADLTIIRSLALLDPHRAWRSTPYFPHVLPEGLVADPAASEVFVYFSTTELETPGVVEALEKLPLPRRGYLPAATDEVTRRLEASGMVVERQPVDEADIVRRTRLLLSAGQHGTMCLGLFSGVPQVCLPQHRENWANTLHSQGTGAVRTVLKDRENSRLLIEHILQAYHDGDMQRSAMRVAREVNAEARHPDAPRLSDALVPIKSALWRAAEG